MSMGFAAKTGMAFAATVVAVLVGLALDEPVFVEQACVGLDVSTCHAWLLDGTVMRVAVLVGLPLALGVVAAAATRDWTLLLLTGVCTALPLGFTLGAGAAERAAYDDSKQVVLGMFFGGGAVAAIPGLASTAAVWPGVGAARDHWRAA
jgi:hypothetical protein